MMSAQAINWVRAAARLCEAGEIKQLRATLLMLERVKGIEPSS